MLREGTAIPAHLWLPAGQWPWPLVLAGHGFTLHKRALFPHALPAMLTGRGMALVAIDAPAHGDRQPPSRRDAPSVDADWRAHWREHAAEVAALDYGATLEAVNAGPWIDAKRVGYWGLSLGTQYGVGVLARQPSIQAAVLGLSGLPDPGPRIKRYAEAVRCPVFFIQQRDDEIWPLARSQALFDALGTGEKTLASSPGRHAAVPEAVFEAACDFLSERLRA